MPKLPVVSGSDANRARERLGFATTRQRGSHIVLRRGSQGCVVPKHRELKAGTLAGLPLIREPPEVALPEVRLFRAGQLRESKVSGWRQC